MSIFSYSQPGYKGKYSYSPKQFSVASGYNIWQNIWRRAVGSDQIDIALSNIFPTILSLHAFIDFVVMFHTAYCEHLWAKVLVVPL